MRFLCVCTACYNRRRSGCACQTPGQRSVVLYIIRVHRFERIARTALYRVGVIISVPLIQERKVIRPVERGVIFPCNRAVFIGQSSAIVRKTRYTDDIPVTIYFRTVFVNIRTCATGVRAVNCTGMSRNFYGSRRLLDSAGYRGGREEELNLLNIVAPEGSICGLHQIEIQSQNVSHSAFENHSVTVLNILPESFAISPVPLCSTCGSVVAHYDPVYAIRSKTEHFAQVNIKRERNPI